MSAADDLAGQIAAFDARDDAIGLVEFLQTGGQDPEQMQIAIYQLLVAKRYQSAYIVASFSIAQGARSLLSSLALAIGGFLHRNPAHAATGIELVAAQATALESSQPQVYRHLHQDILHPALLFLMSTALPAADDQRVLEVLEILKAFSAHFRRVFDWDARVEFSLDNMRQKGLSQQALLIRLASPPARSPRDRRALVVMRELIFPNQSWSRALDVGPRIAQAMNSYGWQCDFHPLRCANLRAEAQEIVERCLQSKVDVLVFDEDIMMMALPERTDLVATLRAQLPALKIVSCLLDAWEKKPDVLKQCAGDADAVWTSDGPSLELWREPQLAGKILQMPLPFLDENFHQPGPTLSSQPQYFGSISGFNWHRAFWLPAFRRAGIPVRTTVANHQSDGLTALQSYARYMHGLAQADCCISLSMRPNLHCAVTGRSFETIHSGSLLIQETSPDLYHYFMVGEHYIEFSSLAELGAAVRFVGEHPQQAQEIRQRGNAYAQAHYSDERLIGYLDKSLYFPQ